MARGADAREVAQERIAQLDGTARAGSYSDGLFTGM